jgi:hypothetical protein
LVWNHIQPYIVLLQARTVGTRRPLVLLQTLDAGRNKRPKNVDPLINPAAFPKLTPKKF